LNTNTIKLSPVSLHFGFANETAVARATAPIPAAAPFRPKISESSHQQAVEVGTLKIRENRREKEKQRKL
jgi:hypothetical protein